MRSVIPFVAVLALTVQGVAAVAAENQVARGEWPVIKWSERPQVAQLTR